jgi:hypothetical protein
MDPLFYWWSLSTVVTSSPELLNPLMVHDPDQIEYKMSANNTTCTILHINVTSIFDGRTISPHFSISIIKRL